jgi:hypothetical protein
MIGISRKEILSGKADSSASLRVNVQAQPNSIVLDDCKAIERRAKRASACAEEVET